MKKIITILVLFVLIWVGNGWGQFATIMDSSDVVGWNFSTFTDTDDSLKAGYQIFQKIDTTDAVIDSAVGAERAAVAVKADSALAFTHDGIKDYHMDWGTGTGQVSTDDVTEGSSNLFDQALPDSGDWSTAYSWGDHSAQNYLDEDDFGNWKVYYGNVSGAFTELALGADGTYLKSTGASSAPTFATPPGGDPGSAINDSITYGYQIYQKIDTTDAVIDSAVGAERATVADTTTADFLHKSGGTMAGNIIMPDDGWIGLSADSGRIVFDSSLKDIVKIRNAFLTVGDEAAAPESAGITITSATAHQFRLAYNASNWFDFECDPSGTMQIRTTGGEVSFTDENVKTSGYLTVGSVIAPPDSQLTVYGGAHISQSMRVEGDIAIEGDDITMGTNTDGYVLVADGTNFSPSATVPIADSASAFAHQEIKKYHVDSTSENFVFDGAYHKTSAETDSAYLTHGGAAATYIIATLTEEEVEDYAGTMVDGGTETRIAVTYTDGAGAGDGVLNFVVDDMTDTVEHYREAIHDTTAAHWDEWLHVSGDVGTGIFDFGGATSLEIPAVDNPTTDAEGEIAWDTNDDAIEVYMGDEGESALIPAYQKIDALIFAPDGINDEVKVFGVDALIYPHGIEIDQVSITLPADAAYSMVFEEWAGDPPVAQNDIETVTTSGTDAYMEVGGGDIDDAAIDADDYIFLHIPNTDVDWIHVQIIFHINDGN